MKGSVTIIVIVSCVLSVVLGISDRFVFKINGGIHDIKEKLGVYNFQYMLQITSTVHSFKYGGSLSSSKIEQVLTEVKKVYKNEIVEIEQARECINWVPIDRIDVTSASTGEDEEQKEESESFFGLNVEKAWLLGYSGSGINIAVLDAGINTDIDDLKKNVNNVLAYNYVDNTKNVTPEFFHSYQTDSFRFVDHGNRCASVIAAEKGNGICGTGIAFEANVVPVKIFSVDQISHIFKHHTSSDIIGAGLKHGLQHIHIFSNSWSPEEKFEPLDMAVREAILEGTTVGRNSLGAIYVVPDGSDGISGSGLANSIYTIAVNSVGIHGTLSVNPKVSACVLTSGLGEGSKLNTNYILTSSTKGCIKSFKGVSAVVAEISSIIALALQARPLLSVRDIQHLLVESSDHKQLHGTITFKRNGAGKLFNEFLGFGLIDAEKMVLLSKNWSLVTNVFCNTLVYKDISHERIRKFPVYTNIYIVSHKILFEMQESRCYPHVDTIEHVVLYIRHEILIERNMVIEIVSPSNTTSIIVDNEYSTHFNMDKRPRNLTSVHFWGEPPFGQWKLIIQAPRLLDEKDLSYTSLSVYGTFDESKGGQSCESPAIACPTRTKKDNTNTETNKNTIVTESTKTSKTSKKKNNSDIIRPYHFAILVAIVSSMLKV